MESGKHPKMGVRIKDAPPHPDRQACEGRAGLRNAGVRWEPPCLYKALPTQLRQEPCTFSCCLPPCLSASLACPKKGKQPVLSLATLFLLPISPWQFLRIHYVAWDLICATLTIIGCLAALLASHPLWGC